MLTQVLQLGTSHGKGAAAGPRILVADDDEAVLLTLSAVLEKIEGATVVGASTFDEAMCALGARPFNVLVTELTIDGPEDGLTLLGCAQEMHPGIAGIVLTGSASLPSAIKALQLGASNYLLKPCNIEALQRAIRVALEKSEQDLRNAERRLASRIAGPVASLRQRIGRLQQRAERRGLDDSLRYDIQHVDLAASRLEATVDTLVGTKRSAPGLATGTVRADVLDPTQARRT